MKKIEVDTFLSFQFVSNPTFSPDGAYIAFVVSTADKVENAYKANLYIYDLNAKKIMRFPPEAAKRWRRSPFPRRRLPSKPCPTAVFYLPSIRTTIKKPGKNPMKYSMSFPSGATA